MVNQGIYKDNKMTGPLGQYGIAKSLVQTPGWKPLEAAGPLEQALGGGGGGGGGFSMRGGGGEYRGRIGADTTNLPPSQRGLYENSAPSLEAIQGAYDANLENGMTHDEIMTLFNDQADRDKKFWADGFAKDPNFSEKLQKKSYAQMTTQANQDRLKLARDRATIKNTQGQTVNDQLRASAGVYDKPRQGAMPGGRTSIFKAPLAKATKAKTFINPRTNRSFSSTRPHW